MLPGDTYSPIPTAPPGVSVEDNCKIAAPMLNPWDFKNNVKKGGPWDFKKDGMQYENFGNFHYGATGNAFGFPLGVLLNEAGRAQGTDGTSDPRYGTPAPRWWMFMGGDGSGSRGDDPRDQYWINEGYQWYQRIKQPGPPLFILIPPLGY